MAKRSRGGVSMTDMSRSPTKDMCRVRGMGVAERASASTFLRISLRRSLWATPKRCSSSTSSSARTACFQIREDFLLFRGAAEAAEHFDARGERSKPFLKGFKMLEGEHGGGRENRDLFVVNDSFEGGTHGNFRFAVADVAAEQAVHGLGAFHVALDVADGGDLVGGLLELEGILEFALEIAVGRKSETFRGLALRVQRQKLVGHVFNGFASARLASVPDGAAEFVERRMRAFEDAVTLHQIHALERNIEARIVGIFEQHELAAMSSGLDLAKSLELADAMVNVDHVVTGLQLGKIAEETGSANFAAGAFDRGRNVEKIGVSEKGKASIGKGDAFGERCANQQHGRGFVRALRGESGGSIFRFAKHVGHFVFSANVRKALDLSGAGSGQENRPSGRELGLHVAHAGNDIAVKTRTGPRGELELGNGTNSESELLDVNLRGFFQCGGEFSFGPEIVRGGR